MCPFNLRKCLAVAILLASPSLRADDVPRTPGPPMPPDLPRRVMEITEAILTNHVEPPVRQQMIVEGLRAMRRAAHQPIPPELGRRASEVVTPDQVAALLAELWPRETVGKVAADTIAEAMLDGLLRAVPGGAERISAKEARVEEQIAGNRYVGIHVALNWLDEQVLPSFREVFPGGPADRAGIRKEELLLEVDGVATKGTSLRAVVDRLRGDEGTSVTVKVRGPKDEKARTLTMVRGQLPRETITGLRKQPSGDWEFRRDGPGAIGYLKVKEIAASTPHELRKLARKMEEQGLRALVLDLRSSSTQADVRSAAMLADCLLESGTIGRIRTAHGETIDRADPDALFRGWPIAVLVDPTTSVTFEWVAAALQDNHRAPIVGAANRGGDDEVRSTVPIGDGQWMLSLTTGRLERGDGRPMVDVDRSARGPRRAGGLVPDHPVERKANRQAPDGPLPILRREAPTDTAPTAPDPALDAAVKILRQAMEAH